ncbi:MAG: hypothetical protein MHM6MM_009180 [Cercozoa sp. M6MM]
MLHRCLRNFVTICGTRSLVRPAAGRHVIVFGWLGAHPRNTLKYQQLFERGRCTVVQPPAINFFRALVPSQEAKMARELKDEIEQRVRSDREAAGITDAVTAMDFVLMSNNGVYNFAALEHHFKHDTPPRLLIDSAPSRLNADIFERGFCGFLTGALCKHSAWEHPVFSPALHFLFHTLMPQQFHEVASLSYHLWWYFPSRQRNKRAWDYAIDSVSRCVARANIQK